MATTHPNVIVCQIGAREHYSIAKAMHKRDRLAALVTDIWVPPGSAPARITPVLGSKAKNFTERYSAELGDATVIAPSILGLFQSYVHGMKRNKGWDAITAHNAWFGRWTVRALNQSQLISSYDKAPVVFAYSYAALEIFKWAKAHGARTILGQIDPGPEEVRLVDRIARTHDIDAAANVSPPLSYWERWQEECALADAIIVNSIWSKKLLEKDIGEASAISVVPLIYDTPEDLNPKARHYPDKFNFDRPLRLLFLGQINVRKGALELIAAMRELEVHPVHLSLVGPIDATVESLTTDFPRNVNYIGAVPRGATAQHYREADVMILPTHSDGFALTQLEAQAHGLPLIVSPFCGDVVRHGEDGFVVEKVSKQSLLEVIRQCLNHPASLSAMSAQALKSVQRFSTSSVETQLASIIATL